MVAQSLHMCLITVNEMQGRRGDDFCQRKNGMHLFMLLAINARFAEPHTICRSIIVSRMRSLANHNKERNIHTKSSAVHVIGKGHGTVSNAKIGYRLNHLMSASLVIGLNRLLIVMSLCSKSVEWSLFGLGMRSTTLNGSNVMQKARTELYLSTSNEL